MSNLTLRILTAIIAAPILIGLIWYGGWSFGLLFITVSGLAQFEFYKLLKMSDNNPLRYWGTLVGVIMVGFTLFYRQNSIAFYWFYLLPVLIALIFMVKLYKAKDNKPFMNIAYTILGLIYVALPFALFIEIGFLKSYYNYELILGFLFMLWASDSGAYFAGVNFGKTKLFERVSPKKSWEGSIGGFAATMLVAFILGKYFLILPTQHWMAVGFIIVVAGTYGDLVESLFKRSIAIKDSGSIIPGHGGFLDRFDGLLIAAPFVLAYLKIVVQ